MASTTSKELTQWQAFLAVRDERQQQAARDAAEGFDDNDREVYEWGEARDTDDEEDEDE